MATATNANPEDFPNVVPQSVIDDSRSITHFSAWTAVSGGSWLTNVDITDAALSTLGQTVTVPAGMLTITQPEVYYDSGGSVVSRISAAMAERLVRGAIAGGVFWQAHYGDPGTSGTANSLGSELGRITIAQGEHTVMQ